jgi:hypothetical protein
VPHKVRRGGAPRTGLHSVGDGSTVPEMGVQGWRWPHKVGGDGEVMLHPTSHHDAVLGERQVDGRKLLEGATVSFRQVRHGGRMGSGGTVSNNGTRHPAQRLYSAWDGRIVAGCLNSTGVGSPSCVRRSAWRGFTFHPGARDVLGHLMLWSGERVRRHGLRGGLERGGDSLEEWDPSSEAEIRSRG